MTPTTTHPAPRQTWLSPAIAVACLLLFALASDRLRASLVARVAHVKEITDVYALPPPAIVKRMAIGYDDALVSVLWASVLYQYGVHVGQNRKFPYATQYIQTIIELDPTFKPAYKFISTFVTMQAVEPERVELDETRAILAKGAEALPDDPDVLGAYATFLMFESSQYLSPEERQQWRTFGAPIAQRAVELGYLNQGLAIVGAQFLVKVGLRDLAIEQLERSYAIAPTEEVRKDILARLQRLQAKTTVDRLKHSAERFLGHWMHEAGFLDETTFVLVGPRRNTAACAGRVGLDAPCALGWAGDAAGAGLR